MILNFKFDQIVIICLYFSKKKRRSRRLTIISKFFNFYVNKHDVFIKYLSDKRFMRNDHEYKIFKKKIEKRKKARLRSNLSTLISVFVTKLNCFIEFNFLILNITNKK